MGNGMNQHNIGFIHVHNHVAIITMYSHYYMYFANRKIMTNKLCSVCIIMYCNIMWYVLHVHVYSVCIIHYNYMHCKLILYMYSLKLHTHTHIH